MAKLIVVMSIKIVVDPQPGTSDREEEYGRFR
jgi:hypothetical protein